ncbi:hypothetical protein LQ564_20230 [Massilia sp. G4R7]|uniref:Uncharacterized protein n=1 Tax=Massilia phyllostachyos TaxID=2898585 RepID=A0ABS8QA68_9BURK|nr:hypothetical protein [Massilia phyllostachyos]MCD2518629.1 hypothetical protein [Massilia phyllostachyos]
MNNALNTIQAAKDGGLARLVRNGVVACMLVCATAGAMAQDRGPRRDEMQQQQMRDRYESRAQDRFDNRANEMRDNARRQEQIEDMRRESEGRRGRLTPDERRELKRQINEANVDLYPNARRR